MEDRINSYKTYLSLKEDSEIPVELVVETPAGRATFPQHPAAGIPVTSFWTAPTRYPVTQLLRLLSSGPPCVTLLPVIIGQPGQLAGRTFHMLHEECIAQNKAAVVPLEPGLELLFAAVSADQNSMHCHVFQGFLVSAGAPLVAGEALRSSKLQLVLDLDETVISAQSRSGLLERYDKALRRKEASAGDPAAMAQLNTEMSLIMRDTELLASYTEQNTVWHRRHPYKAVWESAVAEDGQEVVRPVVRVPELGLIFSRIDPNRPETSMIIRIRPGWQDLHAYLCCEEQPVQPETRPGSLRFDVYVATSAERPYAYEAWRLLDPMGKLFPHHRMQRRIVCIPGDQQKRLEKVFGLAEAASASPFSPPPLPTALILDDRPEVWVPSQRGRVVPVLPFFPLKEMTVAAAKSGAPPEDLAPLPASAWSTPAEMHRCKSIVASIRGSVFFHLDKFAAGGIADWSTHPIDIPTLIQQAVEPGLAQPPPAGDTAPHHLVPIKREAAGDGDPGPLSAPPPATGGTQPLAPQPEAAPQGAPAATAAPLTPPLPVTAEPFAGGGPLPPPANAPPPQRPQWSRDPAALPEPGCGAPEAQQQSRADAVPAAEGGAAVLPPPRDWAHADPQPTNAATLEERPGDAAPTPAGRPTFPVDFGSPYAAPPLGDAGPSSLAACVAPAPQGCRHSPELGATQPVMVVTAPPPPPPGRKPAPACPAKATAGPPPFPASSLPSAAGPHGLEPVANAWRGGGQQLVPANPALPPASVSRSLPASTSAEPAWSAAPPKEPAAPEWPAEAASAVAWQPPRGVKRKGSPAVMAANGTAGPAPGVAFQQQRPETEPVAPPSKSCKHPGLSNPYRNLPRVVCNSVELLQMAARRRGQQVSYNESRQWLDRGDGTRGPSWIVNVTYGGEIAGTGVADNLDEARVRAAHDSLTNLRLPRPLSFKDSLPVFKGTFVDDPCSNYTTGDWPPAQSCTPWADS